MGPMERFLAFFRSVISVYVWFGFEDNVSLTYFCKDPASTHRRATNAPPAIRHFSEMAYRWRTIGDPLLCASWECYSNYPGPKIGVLGNCRYQKIKVPCLTLSLRHDDIASSFFLKIFWLKDWRNNGGYGYAYSYQRWYKEVMTLIWTLFLLFNLSDSTCFMIHIVWPFPASLSTTSRQLRYTWSGS